jgi:hypothetical protein
MLADRPNTWHFSLYLDAIQKPENSTTGHKLTIRKPDLSGIPIITVLCNPFNQ